MEEQEKHIIGLDVVEALKSYLTKEHGKDTGVGQSSISYRLDDDDIVISMEDYFEFLNYGTPNPTTPEEIMGWVERKIMPKIKTKDKSQVKLKIAKNIAKHITKYGPRPFPFVQMMIDNDLPGILSQFDQ